MHIDNICPDCGKFKHPQYPQCYNCSQRKAEEEGRLCVCGRIKSPAYRYCYDCKMKMR